MADITFSGLSELTTVADEDLIAVTDVSDTAESVNGTTKRITKANLVSGLGETVFADDVFRVQDNGDATKQIAFEASGITTGTTRTITVPDSDVTISSFSATFLDDTDAASVRTTLGIGTSNFETYTTVAAALADTGAVLGNVFAVEDYATGVNSGVLFFTWVSAATGTDDGGSYIDHDTLPLQAKQNFPRDFRSVKMFGATGNGTTDDTATCQAAVNAAVGKQLIWPAGVYLVDNITGVSNTTWNGSGVGVSTIKARSALTDDFIKFTSKTYVNLRSLTVDYNNVSTTGNLATVGFLSCTDFSIDRCEIKSLVSLGIGINASSRWRVTNNIIGKDSTATTLNEAILVTTAAGSVDNGYIRHNRCRNTGIILDGTGIDVSYNDISGWGYGAGISTVQDTSTSNNITIHGNIIYNSNNALDADSLPPQGIENWARKAVITGNIVFGCAGNGIFNGGKFSTVDGNVSYDNGKLSVSGSTYGIAVGYADATYNGDRSTYTSNVCFDSLGASGTQTHGIACSSSNDSITVVGNRCIQNKTASYLLPITTVTFAGDSISYSWTYDPASIASGGQTSTTETVAGAELGDFVQVSCDINLAGVVVNGYVNAPNAVTIILTNTTLGAIDLGSATWRVLITKPCN